MLSVKNNAAFSPLGYLTFTIYSLIQNQNSILIILYFRTILDIHIDHYKVSF